MSIIKKSLKIIKLSTRGLFYLKIDMYMKANGGAMKEVVEVCRYGKMVPYTKDIGKII